MPATRAIHVVVFDGFADWEPAYALAELRRWGKRTVRSVSFAGSSVTSMGGLHVQADTDLASVRLETIELLLLPGGEAWEAGAYPRAVVESLIGSTVAARVPVAAICAGTLALARAGVLNDRRHTSNGREYLTRHTQEYSGAAFYEDALAVRDRHVITASGLGAVEFARAIFAELEVFSASDEALWFDMFKHGRPPRSGP